MLGRNVGGGDVDNAEFADLLNVDDSVGLTLHLLDDLASGSDDRADEVARDLHLDDARHERTVVLSRSRHSLFDLTQDEHSAAVSLGQSLGHHFGRKTLDLDVHLAGGDTVFGTADLEVHIAEMVLVAEDVGQDGVAAGGLVSDQTHGDTGNGLLHLHTAVEQRERASANGCHRGTSVGFEDVGNQADGIGERRIVERNHRFEGAFGQIAVTDLTTGGAADTFHLTHAVGREVVVQQETVGALDHGAVDDLLVELGAERAGGQRLRFAASEDGGTVCGRQVASLNPDGTDVLGVAAVETDALVEDHVAHGVPEASRRAPPRGWSR